MFPTGLPQTSNSRGITVASAVVKQFDPTDYTLTTTNLFLVMKYAPRYTGEVRISFEAKTNGIQAMNVIAASANRLLSTTYARNVSEADKINWTLPLGASVATFSEDGNTGLLTLDTIAIGVTTYTQYVHVVNVIEGVPLYLLAKNASATSSPIGNIRNIALSYDILR